MGKEITIVIYKPSTQSTEEYVIIVNPVEVRSLTSIERVGGRLTKFCRLLVQEVQRRR